MKRLILIASFAVLLTPYVASADDKRPRHHKISASEMALAGIATAGLIGVAGYLALRKRTIA